VAQGVGPEFIPQYHKKKKKKKKTSTGIPHEMLRVLGSEVQCSFLGLPEKDNVVKWSSTEDWTSGQPAACYHCSGGSRAPCDKELRQYRFLRAKTPWF
jgi:hypothetical protein